MVIKTYMAVTSDLICISPTFALELSQHHICLVSHYRQVKSMRADYWVRPISIWKEEIFSLQVRFCHFKVQKQNVYLGELILWHGTSRLCPNNSWFFSTIPQGAIPMLTTRPERCCPSIDKASPTCFVTPVSKVCAKCANKSILINKFSKANVFLCSYQY